MNADRVRVAIRIRPRLPAFGEQFAVKCCRKAEGDREEEWNILMMAHPTNESFNHRQQVFRFHHVFDEDDEQLEVYESAVVEMADLCLHGHSATILAYGQTGSGKTHTILGHVSHDGQLVEDSGIFPRVLEDLFAFKARSKGKQHVLIFLSVLEIYNETIRDLLDNSKRVQLRQLSSDDAVPVGLTRERCETLAECIQHYKRAEPLRKVASTSMNDASSRSHACFIIDIFQQPCTPNNPQPPDVTALYPLENGSPLEPSQIGTHRADKPGPSSSTRRRGDSTVSPGRPVPRLSGDSAAERFPITRSSLTLVDLAGSERLKKSQVTGAELKETQAINSSLSCLGNVVNGLYKGDKHIPYRDSVLTMLLKPCFTSPLSKVLLITNLSPSEDSFQESLTSVRFADRVMGLKTMDVHHKLDAEQEMEFLRAYRQFLLLLADLRITMATDDHLPCMRPYRIEAEAAGRRGPFPLPGLITWAQQQQRDALQQQMLNLARRIAFTRANHERWEHRSLQAQGLALQISELDVLSQSIVSQEQLHAHHLDQLTDSTEQLRRCRKAAEEERRQLLERLQATSKAFTLLLEAFRLLQNDLAEITATLRGERLPTAPSASASTSIARNVSEPTGKVFDFTDFRRSHGSGIFDADVDPGDSD
eukprot:GGOE01020648.1.p1 GENE.GGOE01020648.1~~GGOE01020648.1.p1  ORF type:complete len:672 (+),score=190.71 GGOE01020648.1:71-2017(+)